MLNMPANRNLPPADLVFAPVKDEKALGLAVSGGADSLALMLLAAEWAGSHDKRLVVYAVDHGLRPEAAAECAMVVAQAETLGLEARVLHWRGSKPKTGVQAAARKARYRLIGTAMRADGLGMLATAHHRDDQAETVMMRLAHGSGIEGLAGMRMVAAIEGVRVFRPLLDVPRAVLDELVSRHGLQPVRDPSNTDRAYERVRWRALMPALADQGLEAAGLARFAARMARADAALGEVARTQYGQLAARGALGQIDIDLTTWRRLPEEIAVRVLGLALEVTGGRSGRADLGQLETLCRRLRAAEDGGQVTLGGAQVVAREGLLSVWREVGRIDHGPQPVVPGGEMVWDGRFRIVNRGAALLRVAPAVEVTRELAERVSGGRIAGPMAMVRAAPLVAAADGRIAAIGRYCLDAAVKVDFV